MQLLCCYISHISNTEYFKKYFYSNMCLRKRHLF